jgi:hypothetical protein
MIGNFMDFFMHEFINVIIWATTLHQRVRGGDPSDTLATWMGIEPMPTRHKVRGLTTRPDAE